MPLPNLASPSSEACPACRNERFYFANVQAVGLYDGLLRDGVLRMKKGHEESLTLNLGRLLAETVSFSDRVKPELVVPVPMHWTRRITRGTNPPEVLAEMVARKMRIPVATDLLRCRRKTRKQGMLLPDQRRRNIREAFTVSAAYDIRDTCILLIDDVMTTGATGNELSRVLRRAGARHVSVAVVARGTG
jgi:ComF family protein